MDRVNKEPCDVNRKTYFTRLYQRLLADKDAVQRIITEQESDKETIKRLTEQVDTLQKQLAEQPAPIDIYSEETKQQLAVLSKLGKLDETKQVAESAIATQYEEAISDAKSSVTEIEATYDSLIKLGSIIKSAELLEFRNKLAQELIHYKNVLDAAP